MKAKDITGQAPGGQRQKLIELLPLDTPLVVAVFPVYSCDLKCNYCMMSIPKENRHFVSNKITMDIDLFAKCVQDMTQFPCKIKTLRFVGIGEPLLHPEIVNMVRMVKKANIANRIEIITNGIKLYPDVSEALIEAGLDRVVVSIQGTSEKRYKATSNVDIDFNRFLNHLKWLYEHRMGCHVYIKAADSVLVSEADKDKFYTLFGDICDTIGIESTVPIQKGLDLPERDTTQFGLPVERISVCPQPFHYMQINPDGKVVPCYSFEYPEIMGDTNKESIVTIWGGGAYKGFRQDRIKGVCNVTCHDCQIIKYRIFPEDRLEDHKERLKEIYA